MEAKARLERENEDVALRRLQAQATLETERAVALVKSVSAQVSRLLMEVLSQPQRLVFLFSGVLAVFLAYVACRDLLEGWLSMLYSLPQLL